MRAHRGRCRSCRARVLWVRMRDSGKANPLDLAAWDPANAIVLAEDQGLADPPLRLPAGVITWDETGAWVLSKGTRLDHLEAGIPLRVSHFATCPNRRSHRKAAAA